MYLYFLSLSITVLRTHTQSHIHMLYGSLYRRYHLIQSIFFIACLSLEHTQQIQSRFFRCCSFCVSFFFIWRAFIALASKLVQNNVPSENNRQIPLQPIFVFSVLESNDIIAIAISQ